MTLRSTGPTHPLLLTNTEAHLSAREALSTIELSGAWRAGHYAISANLVVDILWLTNAAAKDLRLILNSVYSVSDLGTAKDGRKVALPWQVLQALFDKENEPHYWELMALMGCLSKLHIVEVFLVVGDAAARTAENIGFAGPARALQDTDETKGWKFVVENYYPVNCRAEWVDVTENLVSHVKRVRSDLFGQNTGLESLESSKC